MSKKRKFVKLGSKAPAFADPWSRFNIYKGQVKELENLDQKRSNKIRNAIKGGHLETATEDEFNAYQDSLTGKASPKEVEPTKSQELRTELDEMTKASLTQYYQENFEVSKADVKSFEKLTHDEMVDELLELSEED